MNFNFILEAYLSYKLIYFFNFKAPEIMAKPFWYRFLYYSISAGSQRSKYYIAWVLGDAVNNASGLGFNGYDNDDNPKWDLVTNVNIFKLEVTKKSFDHFLNIYFPKKII
jgi:hypothetical protein